MELDWLWPALALACIALAVVVCVLLMAPVEDTFEGRLATERVLVLQPRGSLCREPADGYELKLVEAPTPGPSYVYMTALQDGVVRAYLFELDPEGRPRSTAYATGIPAGHALQLYSSDMAYRCVLGPSGVVAVHAAPSTIGPLFQAQQSGCATSYTGVFRGVDVLGGDARASIQTAMERFSMVTPFEAPVLLSSTPLQLGVTSRDFGVPRIVDDVQLVSALVLVQRYGEDTFLLTPVEPGTTITLPAPPDASGLPHTVVAAVVLFSTPVRTELAGVVVMGPALVIVGEDWEYPPFYDAVDAARQAVADAS